MYFFESKLTGELCCVLLCAVLFCSVLFCCVVLLTGELWFELCCVLCRVVLLTGELCFQWESTLDLHRWQTWILVSNPRFLLADEESPRPITNRADWMYHRRFLVGTLKKDKFNWKSNQLIYQINRCGKGYINFEGTPISRLVTRKQKHNSNLKVNSMTWSSLSASRRHQSFISWPLSVFLNPKKHLIILKKFMSSLNLDMRVKAPSPGWFSGGRVSGCGCVCVCVCMCVCMCL